MRGDFHMKAYCFSHKPNGMKLEKVTLKATSSNQKSIRMITRVLCEDYFRGYEEPVFTLPNDDEEDDEDAED